MKDILQAITDLFKVLSPMQRWVVLVTMCFVGVSVYVPTHIAGQQEAVSVAETYTSISHFLHEQDEANCAK